MSHCCGSKPSSSKPPSSKSSSEESTSCRSSKSPESSNMGLNPKEPSSDGCCDTSKSRLDWMLWGSLSLCTLGYFGYFFGILPTEVMHFGHAVFELLNRIWWGLVLGVVFVGLLSYVPRELVLSVLGKGGSFPGVLRATAGGVLLDLCSHGILAVGMKLYERGASAGQVMAFLLASPWNSLSLTLILIGLVGWQLTLLFILLSMVIGVITGLLFEKAVAAGVLPSNPNEVDLPEGYQSGKEFKALLAQISFSLSGLRTLLKEGFAGSKVVLRWSLFGVVLASLIRVLIDTENFEVWFGPSMLGLVLTMAAATVIEVCSEGSTPIAADVVNRAGAKGNGFAFLMAGVATDYTEVMSIKATMASWKMALFLPLLTLPQVFFIGWCLNQI
ncbi:MAG: permease [Cellvibrionaceae bacterium]